VQAGGGVGDLGAVLLDGSLARGLPRHAEGVRRSADDEQPDVGTHHGGGVRDGDDVRRQPGRDAVGDGVRDLRGITEHGFVDDEGLAHVGSPPGSLMSRR
jgi:hypothetical protein